MGNTTRIRNRRNFEVEVLSSHGNTGKLRGVNKHKTHPSKQMPKELLVVSGKIILKTDKNNSNKNRMFPLSFSEDVWRNPLLGDNLLQA